MSSTYTFHEKKASVAAQKVNLRLKGRISHQNWLHKENVDNKMRLTDVEEVVGVITEEPVSVVVVAEAQWRR